MSVKAKFASSSLWLMIGAVFGQLSGFIVFVMLARLLTPAEFGIVAFASIFIDLSKQFLSAGIPDALIRHSDWNEDLASTAFWINIGMSVAIVALCLCVGVPLLQRAGYAGIGPVFAALSSTLILDSMRIVFDARLRREFKFKTLTSREVSTQIVAGIIGVAMALAGAGVWALVANRVIASILGTVATWWLVRWQPRLVFSREKSIYLLRFASGLMGGQILAILNAQVAPLIIALLLGPTVLALYRAGNRILSVLTQITIAPLQSAALSAFSRLKDPAALSAVYLRLTGACSLVACPVFIGTGALSPELVVVLLGPQWKDSGMIMAVSSVIIGAAALNYFFTPALTAAGNTRYSFNYYLSAVIGNTLLALATSPFGVVAVAASQTARAYLMLPMPLIYLRRVIGLSPSAALRSVAQPFLASVAMGAIMILINHNVIADKGPLVRILLLAPLGALIYLALMFSFGRSFMKKNLAELKPFLPAFIKSRIL